jgi:hypothetical protein
VYIRFLDGTSIRFRAHEFNVNVGQLPTEEKPKRFYYKDANGRDTPIYLRLDHVAAIRPCSGHSRDPCGEQHPIDNKKGGTHAPGTGANELERDDD